MEIVCAEHTRSLGFIDAEGPLETATRDIIYPIPDGGFDIIAKQAVTQCKFRRTTSTPVKEVAQFANDCDGVPRGTLPGTLEHSQKCRLFYATKMSYTTAQTAEEMQIAVFLVDADTGDVRPFNDSAFALGLAADVQRGDLSPAIADYWSWRMTEVSAASKWSPLEPVTDLLNMVLPKQRSDAPNDVQAGKASKAAMIAQQCFYGVHEFLPTGPILDYVQKVVKTSLPQRLQAKLQPEIQSGFLPIGQPSARHSDGAACRPLRALQHIPGRQARASLGSQLPMAQRSVTTMPRSSLSGSVAPRCSAGAPKLPPLRALGGLGKAARAGAAILQLAAQGLAASAR
jgi:hypothetical protein